MKKALLVILGLSSLVAVPIFGQTIPRSYELQCSFNDDSKLLLKQHYTWNALAAMLPADVTTTEYTNYQVRFINKNGKKSDWLKNSGSFGSGIPNDLIGAQMVCSNVSIIDNRVFYGINYLDEKMQWKESPSTWPSAFYLKIPAAEQPEAVRDQLNNRQLSPSSVESIVFGKRVIYEQSLVDMSPQGKRKDGNLNITAVYQSESSDEGKTWTAPIITTDAKIFELGKSLDAQSFVGLPYSFNGKKFNAQRPLK